MRHWWAWFVGLFVLLQAAGALADPNGPVQPAPAATQSSLAGCIYVSAGVSLTNGQQAALQCNATGQLITSATGGGGGGAVTIADGASVTLGALADATWSGSGSGSEQSILKYIGVKNEAIRSLLASPLAVTGTFWQATQPVSIASLPALPANQSVNVAQINAVTPLMGNGVSGTGAQRVTIASDSTGQVALAAGAATIGALTANQSVNNTQVGGVAISVGNGVSGTGVQRVTLASDSTGQVALAAGANTIGALTANQSVNVAQINGVAATMGNGVAGTGVQRVTIASDSTGVIGATQSGAWNITNVSGTVSLPTGAATSAKQPALGTAGTPSADVLSVQGVAGQKPIPVVATANPTSTMTRPANTTAYANLQLVASNTVPGSVVVSSFAAPATAACSFDLALAKLSINNTGTGPGTGLDGWNLTLRLYAVAAPTYVNGDGGAYRVATGGANLIGKFSCSLEQLDDAATGFCSAATNFPISVKLASGTTVWWDLQSNGAITPQSGKVATLTPYLKQDTC